jgi:hypothetical protein
VGVIDGIESKSTCFHITVSVRKALGSLQKLDHC